jgi:hypothetical protein
MIVVNIFENIIKYIDKALNFIFSASRDSYTPLNFENIKFLAFMLGLFLFLLENIITIFLRSISDTINIILSSGNETINSIYTYVFNKSIGEWDSFYFNPHNYIRFDAVFLIALILSYINIFIIKNTKKIMNKFIYLSVGVCIAHLLTIKKDDLLIYLRK